MDLGEAILSGRSLKEIKDFITSGVDVNKGTPLPLFAALKKSNIELTKLLVKHGANVNSIVNKFPILYHALNNYSNFEFANILISNGSDLNYTFKNKSEDTLLTYLILNEKIKESKYLISKGADINLASKKDDASPLMAAIIIDNIELVEMLIKKGANVNRFYEDNTPILQYLLHDISSYNIIKALLEGGAKITDEDIKLANKNLPIVKLLIKHGAKINSGSYEGASKEVVKYLKLHDNFLMKTIKNKLMKKYDYRSEKTCDIFGELDQKELIMVADLYKIDHSLTRFQICQKLRKILDQKIEEKKNSLGTCINESGIGGDEIKDIDPRKFFTFEENGKLYCEDVVSLYEQIFMHKLKKNPYTNVLFTDETINRINAHYKIYMNDKIEHNQENNLPLSAHIADLYTFFYYPISAIPFEEATMDKIKEFLKRLPVKIPFTPDLTEYKKDILDSLIEYIKEDRDRAFSVERIWNFFWVSM